MRWYEAVSLSLILGLGACAAKDENDDGRGDHAGSEDAGSSSRDDAASAGRDSGASDGGGLTASGDAGATQRDASQADGGARAEVCDGVDNDGDGIIDNVDKEKDGVCDCLNIATIGAIGPCSNG